VKKVALIVFFNIALTAILLELAALGYFYFKESAFYYFREAKPLATPYSESIDSFRESKHMLHPFFGFIARPGKALGDSIPRERLDRMSPEDPVPPWVSAAANDYGYFSEVEYPYIALEDEFVVGIFGGSVAHYFALQGAEQLEENLRVSGLAGLKDIKILNFAQRGNKQPQQLQSLTYFMSLGQKFDLVINIDGFNEIALSSGNYSRGVALSMPSMGHMRSLLHLSAASNMTLEQFELYADYRALEKKLSRLDQRMDAAPLALMHAWYKFSSQRMELQKVQASFALEAMGGESGKHLFTHINALREGVTKENRYDAMADLWAESSLVMNDLLTLRKTPYIHVIQPNQYFSKHDFDDVEARVALNDRSPYKTPMEQGYQFLLERVPRLREEGVDIRDAIDLFDEVDGHVFSDDCCHFNQRGNEILADFIIP